MDTKEYLIEEKEQIDARIAHIAAHFDSVEFTQIPGEDQERLNLQREFMQKYSDVLGERIRVLTQEKDA